MPELRVWTVQPGDLSKILRGLKYLPPSELLGEPVVVDVSAELPTLSEKVAWRFAHTKIGAFFNVGDLILYGKYKNKKGKIVRFLTNEKGQPLIEIEPIPKGRKKNKIMGLFKIWNVAAIEKALAEKPPVDHLAARIAARFLPAEK